MNAKTLDSIIRSEVKREMKRRRFIDDDMDMEDDDDMDMEDDDDMDIEDMDLDMDMEDDDDMDMEDGSAYDMDEDVEVEDEDEDEDEDKDVEDEDEDEGKVEAKDAFNILLRREVNRQVKRKLKARDSWKKLSNDMQLESKNKNVMDKRDENLCNAWKKTIGKES